MINNFEILKKHMDFSDPDKFYYLQILARSKDGHNKATKVIKNYYISNEEYLESHKNQIIDLCNFFNARAYLRLNRRSYKMVALENLKQLANSLANEQYHFVQKSFSKACGRTNVEENKIWIVDIDIDKNDSWLSKSILEISNKIKDLQSQIRGKDYKVLGMIPTPNGYHVLSNPFRKDVFMEFFPDLSIHTDNPTILYAPMDTFSTVR